MNSFKYLDCIWIQIKKLEDNDWKENQIYRPYTAFENALMSASPIEFPSIVPPEYSEHSIFPLPRVIFRMFDYTDVPEVSYIYSTKKQKN
jgi:nuclear cap-binding protein subunit 1